MKNRYMQKALNEAWKYQFLTYPNPAVGSCVVLDDEVLAVEAHHKAGESHAEVNALKSAFIKLYPNSKLNKINSSKDIHEFLINNHNDAFINCEIFVTLEPCNHIGKTPACANLIKELKLKKVYIGMLDPNNTASGGLETLKNSNVNVDVGILKEKCEELLIPFILWQKNKFSFFKIAMRKDGSIDGGYITTQDSLNLVHEIRTKLVLMVIGGNTVRIDRPTLDSRFAKVNKSANILIYSKEKRFDTTIKLFNVANRDVTISNDISNIKSKFTMIEGGYGLLNSIKDNIDMIMVFKSHKNNVKNIEAIEKYKFLKIHSYFINKYDEVEFYINK
jgi:diaminohydroxyphosphoribosylaminopyrimidine deaminase/5-amino-6-(5-phosphoribosylamino)uracil reductase